MLPELPKHRPLIMGILNVTPDSFSGDGLMAQKDYVVAAHDLALEMLKDGADILDIGGESSRPGAEPVSTDEEIRRVLPVIDLIKKAVPQALIAVDTVKAAVADAALQTGAFMINDISALGDKGMAAIVAKHKAYLVLMDNRSKAQNVTRDAKVGGEYQAAVDGDIVPVVARDLAARAELAKQRGVVADKILLDPGIGFGKSLEQNLALINRVDELRELGYPVLIGPSRKSFIGRVLDTDVEERLEGTAAAVAVSALRGAAIIRVHDVKFMARVAKMAAAIASN
ncbi:MAG TPA: dihydropteroate synthase [Alphaproteobacteria bacterium]|nr:dihydropteroate synthase [Alphaproteobacteria bacterium]